jgi:chromosome segregation ATPase
VDYSAELKNIESEISKREAKRNQLQGLLEAKKAELEALNKEIEANLGCKPEEIVSKGESIKLQLEKNITEMKKVLGI